jgi:adenosylmethionine-8-amino-7-oxononanoate aminotransferase
MEEWLRDKFPQHRVRTCGLIAGIELRQADGTAFPSEMRRGAQVCFTAREFGLLTRPIRDTVVLMPPLCTSEEELRFAVEALEQALIKHQSS